jgi:hypothetical protein
MSSSFNRYSDEICAQRKANGDPCQSPALRGERFCHYHKVMGLPKANIDNKPSGHAYLPVFEDAVSIQSAITEVCEMMLHRCIEPKEASILLYAMQVASTNMAHLNGDKALRFQENGKKVSGGPESSAPPSSPAPSTANASPTISSAPQPLPPGTIQACEQTAQAVEPPGNGATTGI